MFFWGLIVAVMTGVLPPSVERTGRFDVERIPEASGIVKSRRYPGIFWVHNDSGNAPVLFAVRIDGSINRSFRLAVPNLDWEDLAIDERGKLYVADIGNNTGYLRVRSIYQFDEPDPSKAADSALVPSASFFFSLPPKNRFDAESLICERGLATLIVKSHDGKAPEMFTLDLGRPAPVSRPGQLTLAGRLSGFLEPATGASLAVDGQMLAVCSTSVTRVYQREKPEGWTLLSEVRYAAMQAEGVTWDGNDLILAVEHDGLYRIREQTWRAAVRAPGRLSRSVGKAK